MWEKSGLIYGYVFTGPSGKYEYIREHQSFGETNFEEKKEFEIEQGQVVYIGIDKNYTKSGATSPRRVEHQKPVKRNVAWINVAYQTHTNFYTFIPLLLVTSIQNLNVASIEVVDEDSNYASLQQLMIAIAPFVSSDLKDRLSAQVEKVLDVATYYPTPTSMRVDVKLDKSYEDKDLFRGTIKSILHEIEGHIVRTIGEGLVFNDKLNKGEIDG